MSCTCLPGFTGKGDVRCDRISKDTLSCSSILLSSLRILASFIIIVFSFVVEPIEAGCSSDSECSSSEACRNRNCINPCIVDKPCSPSAICSVQNHKSTCTCPPGFEGDPYRQCSKSKLNIFLVNSKEVYWCFIFYTMDLINF